MSLTKKEIRNTLADRFGLPQHKVGAILDAAFAEICAALARGDRVELRNFAIFDVAGRTARRKTNPRTGAPVDVPARHVITFKPGKEMVAGEPVAAEAGLRNHQPG